MRVLRSARGSRRIAGAGVPVVAHLRAPASVQDAETWRRRLAALLQEHGDGIAIVEIALES